MQQTQENHDECFLVMDQLRECRKELCCMDQIFDPFSKLEKGIDYDL